VVSPAMDVAWADAAGSGEFDGGVEQEVLQLQMGHPVAVLS
jgi:hypothetical protein